MLTSISTTHRCRYSKTFERNKEKMEMITNLQNKKRHFLSFIFLQLKRFACNKNRTPKNLVLAAGNPTLSLVFGEPKNVRGKRCRFAPNYCHFEQPILFPKHSGKKQTAVNVEVQNFIDLNLIAFGPANNLLEKFVILLQKHCDLQPTTTTLRRTQYHQNVLYSRLSLTCRLDPKVIVVFTRIMKLKLSSKFRM